MFFSSRLCTRPVLVRLRFRFLYFFVRMWLWNACLRFTLPVPVSLNRFFAPDLVFIFGMTALFSGPDLVWVGAMHASPLLFLFGDDEHHHALALQLRHALHDAVLLKV